MERLLVYELDSVFGFDGGDWCVDVFGDNIVFVYYIVCYVFFMLRVVFCYYVGGFESIVGDFSDW